MANDLSTNIKSLNIFQKLRLNYIKRRMENGKISFDNFSKLPDYIKYNSDMIPYAVKQYSDEDIRKLEPNIVLNAIKFRGDISEERKEGIIKGYSTEILYDLVKNNTLNNLFLPENFKNDIIINLVENGKGSIISELELGNNQGSFETNLYNDLIKRGKVNELKESLKYFKSYITNNIVINNPENIKYLSENRKAEFANFIIKNAGDRYYENSYNKIISLLPIEEQERIIEKSDLKLIDNCTLNAKKTYIKKHPECFMRISDKSKLELIGEDVRLFRFANPDLRDKIITCDNGYQNIESDAKIIANLLKDDIKNSKITNNLELYTYDKTDKVLKNLFKNPKEMSDEDVIKYALHSKMLSAVGKLNSAKDVLHGADGGESKSGIEDYTKEQINIIQSLNPSAVAKLVQIDSNYILPYLAGTKNFDGNDKDATKLTSEERISSEKRANELFISLFGNEKFEQYKDCIKEVYNLEEKYSKEDKGRYYFLSPTGRSGYNDVQDYYNHMKVPLDEMKILFNKQVIQNCNPETIKTYFSKLSNGEKEAEEFQNIIKEAYGERAYELVKSRPKLDVHSINSLEVFDEKILNNFGEGFAHNCISYNVRDFSEFLEIVKNPEKLELFKSYYNILSGVYGKNIETTQKAISEFEYSEELLRNTKGKDLTNMQALNLTNVICGNRNNLNIKTIEDLNNYNEIANRDLLKRVNSRINVHSKESSKKVEKIKQEICQNLLGIDFKDDPTKEYGTSLCRLSSLYDISKESKDSEHYSDNEKRLLNIFEFLSNPYTDSKNLKEFVNNISKQNSMMLRDYTSVAKIIDKVQEKEIKDVNKNILSIEKLDKICESEKEKGSLNAFKEETEGVQVYHLNGVPFVLFEHNATGMPLDELLSYEGQAGNSAICSRAVTNKMEDAKYSLNNRYLYGQIPENGIIDVNRGDANTTHAAKRTRASGITTQISNIEELKSENEVAFYRRERNENEISNDNSGGVISPMAYGIACSKNSKPKIAKATLEMCKKAGIPIIVYHEEAYVDKDKDKEIEEQDIAKDER